MPSDNPDDGVTIEWACNSVLIIESLREEDDPLGEQLQEDLLRLFDRTPDLKSDAVHRVAANSPAELLGVLAAVKDHADRGMLPALHFECHGDPSGLLLQPGDQLVPWEQIRDALTNINFSTGGRLFATLAACSGGHLLDLIDPTQPAPFWGLLGAGEDFSERAARVVFREFYRSLLLHRNFSRAMDEMRQEAGSDGGEFDVVTARSFFLDVFAGLALAARDPMQVNEGVARALDFLAASTASRGIDVRDSARARFAYSEQGIEELFLRTRATFFMADSDPTILERARLEWHHVLERVTQE